MLVFIISIVILSSTQTALLQGKMTEALRDSQVSLNAVEAAITQAGRQLDPMVNLNTFDEDGALGFYSKDHGPLITLFDWEVHNSVTWSGVNGVEVKYFVVHLGQIKLPDQDYTGIMETGYGQTAGGGIVELFKIVAHSGGNSDFAERTVMAFYGKRF